MKNLLLIALISVFLAACGTSVPLNDVPVTDAAPKAVGADAGATGAAGSGGSAGGVVPVDLGNTPNPAIVPGVSRLVYFDYDSFVVKPEFQSLIAAHAKFLRDQPTRKVAIEGHTDERGGREYNLALGQKRAEAVRNALSILGVSQNQMEAVSFGKEKPVVAGSDEASFAKNRRAEIRYP
ncbi:peptidoglycan-associated lipoprotein Pal [Rhodoferax sp.]|uniref:peptidoglycan-associated lipoprotein Pal n=1 Tax=Rhodoferax sp. TaxID=50421 RepID=UPI0026341B75|nr:peptidoglycan-associated lipoprotein Pal [Rhodoferax sp.]MDD2920315.1 peptidoglycan-associated lipoprotein Pal [Rhodoferax sp.]